MRRELWEGLYEIAENVAEEAWCIGVDFNSVLSLRDVRGARA